MSTTNPSTRWNPNAIRRCVRVDNVHDDGIVTWKTKSFTQPGSDDRYHPAIDFVSGQVTCDCPDHTYRRAKLHPTIHTPEKCCKHVARIIENLKRKAGAL